MLLRRRPGVGDHLLEDLHLQNARYPKRADNEARCALKSEGLRLRGVTGQQIVDRLLMRLEIRFGRRNVDAGLGEKTIDGIDRELNIRFDQGLVRRRIFILVFRRQGQFGGVNRSVAEDRPILED